ncbi:helix-turn-helix domain-containing protein [Paenibacillus nasutitermitis]|uniref:HTH cro/C1-type domain-containing protein n=1 Tax=Paenibacillus nasutitermitis TaxID=1652958 RepID=A0A916YTW7_9BACL|nr:helix-turn-helix transcriptional regulator [Paenibacillus nasutitermitis]GGD59977.1 hypothetical protein GCM10010911_17300 [Paenibacillus nasutitermitis]
MKIELGSCLLALRLQEAGMTLDELASMLFYKPERLNDYIDKKRIMPLKTAISIAETLRCGVTDLYELIPVSPTI